MFKIETVDNNFENDRAEINVGPFSRRLHRCVDGGEDMKVNWLEEEEIVYFINK